jgi:hypothetical protein
MMKTTYMCMSVRGAIRNISTQRGKRTGLQDDKGRPLNKEQAISALMDELAKGHETIPMGAKCGNPCGNSDKCKGFDFGEHGGCPGYEVDEVPAC